MFLVAANTRQAIVGQKEWITTGSSGIQVQFLFSSDWNSLAKFAVFRNAEIEESVIPIALPASGLTELPAENCAAEYVDEKVYVGVYGTDGLGHIIIPTIWVSLGVLKEGAAYEGMDPPQPTQDMWAQILAIAQNAGAENAAAAERSAGEAAASAEAIQDMGVEAETLAAGSEASVEKTVDPETGEVTLSFGIPRGNQGNPGTTPDFQIGTVETLPATAPATATITGTPAEPVLNLGIPQGPKGDPGQSGGSVNDVQIDGNSIVTDGVAEIPLATSSNPGIVYPYANRGLAINSEGQMSVTKASDNSIKAGSAQYAPIVPSNQHGAAFYGLAKAAGDATQAASDDPLGTYTDGAKAAIKNMIGATAGGIGFDDSETYAAGSIGAEVSNQKNAISELESKVISDDLKTALMSFVDAVAYKNATVGNQVHSAMYDALYGVEVESVTASFDQSYNFVHAGDSLDTLKQYLTVTANYTSGTQIVVTDYTLTGTLVAGTSVITVTYANKTTTFSVKVTGNVPAGYTRHDYIQTSAEANLGDYRAIILKEYADLNDYSIICEFDAVNGTIATGSAVFGGRLGSGSENGVAIYITQQKAAMHTHGTDTGFKQDISKGNKNVLAFVNNGLSPSNYSVNGATAYSITWGNDNTINVAPAIAMNRVPGTANRSTPIRCGELELVDLSGNVASHYTPCVRDADSVVGIYDVIDGVFYTCSNVAYATIGDSHCLYNVGDDWS